MNKEQAIEEILYYRLIKLAAEKDLKKGTLPGINIVTYYNQEKEYAGYRKFNHR